MHQHAFRPDFFTDDEKKERDIELRNPAVKSILQDLAATVRGETKDDPWYGQDSQLPSKSELIRVRNAILEVNKEIGK
jgi:hypothetical protein